MPGEQGSATLIPRPISGIDVRALPIGPKEAFVLSQVDGRSTDRDIALFTGLGPAEVQSVLSNLAALGAIQYGSVTPKSGTGMATPKPPAGTSGTHVKVTPLPEMSEDIPTLYEPEELSEPADIPDERKRLILSTYYGLESSNHYELFELAPTADKKAVKSAYFDRVAIFHPDRYFGKNLGSFKSKLERIFERLTEAHDTLTRAQKRAEYDRYLESQKATQALDGDDASTRAEQVRAEIEEEARRLGVADTVPPPPLAGAPEPTQGGSSARRDAASGAGPSTPARVPTPEERRQHLARKLSFGQRSHTPAPPTTPSSDGLRALYDRRVEELRSGRVARFLEQSEHALSAGNRVAALNALRVAASLVPDDAALQERLGKLEQETAASLADQYIEQARYEERERAYDKAAEAYERAARGRPSANLYERAAHCLLESRGDARKAVEMGRKAVEMSPHAGNYRVTLARAYARAGMEKSALAELDRASAGGASADLVKDWERRIKRGEV